MTLPPPHNFMIAFLLLLAPLPIYRAYELMVEHSQSKLSQAELLELQRATNFDKKELQQWYKGECLSVNET